MSENKSRISEKLTIRNRLIKMDERFHISKWPYFLLVFLLPVGIYVFFLIAKSIPGYEPFWTPQDLLSYLSIVSGAVVAVIGLTLSIRNNRIQMEAAAKNVRQEKKLDDVRALFYDIVLALNTDHLILAIMEAKPNNYEATALRITKFEIFARNLLDRLKLYISPQEFVEIGEAMDEVIRFYLDVKHISNDLVQCYRILQTDEKNNEVLQRISAAEKKLTEMDKTQYQQLLQFIREFMNNRIYEVI